MHEMGSWPWASHHTGVLHSVKFTLSQLAGHMWLGLCIDNWEEAEVYLILLNHIWKAQCINGCCFRVHTCVCRGGLIFWADLIGAPKIVSKLDQLASQFRGAGLAGFFEPCDYLRQAAASGRKLSAGPTSAATSKL
jgi:hypothetical protein